MPRGDPCGQHCVGAGGIRPSGAMLSREALVLLEVPVVPSEGVGDAVCPPGSADKFMAMLDMANTQKSKSNDQNMAS